jgi:hypothetical protein
MSSDDDEYLSVDDRDDNNNDEGAEMTSVDGDDGEMTTKQRNKLKNFDDLLRRRTVPRLGSSKKRGKLRETAKQMKGDLETAARYVVTDIRRHKLNFCIGAFTVFLVVMFTTVLRAAIARAPIVFMKLAEDEVGEMDVVITPGGGAGNGGVSFSPSSGTIGTFNANTTNATMTTTPLATMPASVLSAGVLLNFTEVNSRVGGVSDLVGMAPRWLALARMQRPDNSSINSTAIVLVIDQVRELQIGLGRAFQHAILVGAQTHASGVVLRRLGITPDAGQNVTMVLDLLGLAAQLLGAPGSSPAQLLPTLLAQALGVNATQALGALGNFSFDDAVSRLSSVTQQQFTASALASFVFGLFNASVPADLDYSAPLVTLAFDRIADALIIRQNFTVVDSLETPDGKFPKALGNVMMIERAFVEVRVVVCSVVRCCRDVIGV